MDGNERSEVKLSFSMEKEIYFLWRETRDKDNKEEGFKFNTLEDKKSERKRKLR